MLDLIHMAFVRDLTRVATLQITAFQPHMSALPVSQLASAFLLGKGVQMLFGG
jgi:hypothetical protein